MTQERIDREAVRQLIKEEAEYWDSTDTSEIIAQETEWFQFEWTVREDRCDRCGAGMEHRRIDLHLAAGRVTLHNITWYVCRTPKCGQTKLPSGIENLIADIEAAVERAITSITESEAADVVKT